MMVQNDHNTAENYEGQMGIDPDNSVEQMNVDADVTSVDDASAAEPVDAELVAESAPAEAEASAEPSTSEESGNFADPAVVESLKQEIESLKAQMEERTNQYLRIAADFENFRRRTQKEREDQEIQIKCSTIKEMLPVVDNFERARAQIKPQTDAEMTIHKSYQSVYKQLVDCLKRVGVSPMRADGAEFDPNLHEAVMREPTDEYPEGTVIEELMRGYVLGDRVLRHAMVKVAAAPEPAPSNEDSEPDNEA